MEPRVARTSFQVKPVVVEVITITSDDASSVNFLNLLTGGLEEECPNKNEITLPSPGGRRALDPRHLFCKKLHRVVHAVVLKMIKAPIFVFFHIHSYSSSSSSYKLQNRSKPLFMIVPVS